MTDLQAKARKLITSFRFYARNCLKIRTKPGAIKPFETNKAQDYIHERIEDQRRRTGKVRVLILKGRQQGCTTYVQGRFFKATTQNQGARVFILTHQDDATSNIFDIAKRYLEKCPEHVKPSTKTSNKKELIFDKLDSSYRVGTAGSVGTGRSDTVQYFHGSEVAFWPNAETHVAGALQAVPDEAGTEVILESTSAGPRGVFYEMYKDAAAGIGDYEAIFVPWFWQPEYRKDATGFEPTSEEQDYARKHGLDLEQLAWRRSKMQVLKSKFRREYPCNELSTHPLSRCDRCRSMPMCLGTTPAWRPPGLGPWTQR